MYSTTWEVSAVWQEASAAHVCVKITAKANRESFEKLFQIVKITYKCVNQFNLTCVKIRFQIFTQVKLNWLTTIFIPVKCPNILIRAQIDSEESVRSPAQVIFLAIHGRCVLPNQKSNTTVWETRPTFTISNTVEAECVAHLKEGSTSAVLFPLNMILF